MASTFELLEVGGREVKVTNPDKVYWPEPGYTKMDLVRYYLAVADGALRGAGGRPMALKRFVDGAAGAFFFQKRAPDKRPEWIETVSLSFPSGRTAEEVVLRDAASLAWVANLGCLDLNPHPVRARGPRSPDELRVDLDPVPGVPWADIRTVALVARRRSTLSGWSAGPRPPAHAASTSTCASSRAGPTPEVRRAALALARDVEARAPKLATSKWWKEERHGVFLDYNQNAKDRTVARPTRCDRPPDARVSMPLTWDEVPDVVAEDFTLATVPALFAQRGDRHEGIDAAIGSLEALLELSARHETDEGWAMHRGRRTIASRRASRRACSHRSAGQPRAVAGGPPPVDEAAHRDRSGREEERGPRRARTLEGAPSGRRGQAGAGRRAGRRDARTLHDLDAHPRQPRARAGGRAAPAGAARTGLRPVGRVPAASRLGGR